MHGWKIDQLLYSELSSGIKTNYCNCLSCRLLDEGASVNATCRPSRTTALQLATLRANVNIVQLLLNRGANVKRRDRSGRQAIHFAAAAGYDVILGLLLETDKSLVDSQIRTDTTDPRDADTYDSWSHDHDSVTAQVNKLTCSNNYY